MNQNKEAWNDTYSKKEAYMLYPREPVVVLYHRFKHLLPTNITFLDYGFGSGNHSEFMIEKVNEIYGLEISEEAIKLNLERLNKYPNFKEENLRLSHNDFIEDFENKFDFIIAWNCLSYNTHEELNKVIDYLHKYLKKDGILIVSMATQRSGFRKFSEKISHNTYRIGKGVPEQEGCTNVIPQNSDDFEGYYSKFKILDIGHEEMMSYKKDELQSHYYGVFQK